MNTAVSNLFVAGRVGLGQQVVKESSAHAARKKVALDLFSGTNSVSRRLAKRGYQVVSVDIDPRGRPTHCADVEEWDYSIYKKGYFDVIAVSPPCTEYSQAKSSDIRPPGES